MKALKTLIIGVSLVLLESTKTTLVKAFTHTTTPVTRLAPHRRARPWSATNKGASGSSRGPNLVDKSIFVAAFANLKAEIAKQEQQQQPEVNGANVAPNGGGATPNGSSSSSSGGDTKDGETFYAIGKVQVKLDVSTGNPGMDLAEASNGLVLVSGVAGHALEAGIQTGDTITGVAAASAFQDTKAYCLEDTARVLMGAMKLALQNGESEIQLELNRLIKMKYA